VLQYENNANKQVTFTYNALNQVTGYSGTRGNKINVTGTIPTAWTLETVNVEPNSTPAKAVEADIYGAFFVARNVELEDGTSNSIGASADGLTLAGNSVASDTASSITFEETPDVDFGYDDDGRRTSKTEGASVTAYSYDFLGRLTQITYPDDSYTKFYYDALGRKFREEEWDATPSKVSERRYVYNGFTVILELDGSDDPVAEYVYGPNVGGGIGGLLFQKRAGAYSYYHYDAQGNVTSITDEMENAVALYEYSAYGRLLTKAGTAANDFLYSTKPYHAKSGLYYFGFRWYDPATGRWMTRDPLNVLDGFNLYQYAGGDPVSTVDPYGLFSKVDPDRVFRQALGAIYSDPRYWAGGAVYSIGVVWTELSIYCGVQWLAAPGGATLYDFAGFCTGGVMPTMGLGIGGYLMYQGQAIMWDASQDTINRMSVESLEL